MEVYCQRYSIKYASVCNSGSLTLELRYDRETKNRHLWANNDYFIAFMMKCKVVWENVLNLTMKIEWFPFIFIFSMEENSRYTLDSFSQLCQYVFQMKFYDRVWTYKMAHISFFWCSSTWNGYRYILRIRLWWCSRFFGVQTLEKRPWKGWFICPTDLCIAISSFHHTKYNFL